MERRYDLIIIDTGPAGVGAVIHGSRTGLETAMLGMDAPEGKLIKTVEISNRPGTIETNGAKLASDTFEHSTSFGVEYLYGDVIHVEDGVYKKIICEDGTEYETKAAIVATGAQERMMNVPGGLENVGRGVSCCTVCDDALFRDQKVVVVGDGNSALEEANYLTQFASKVNIIIRRDVFRADSIAQNAVKDNPKVTVVTKHVPVYVVDDGVCVTGLVIRNVDTNVETEMKIHGISPYIRLDLATPLLEGLGILNECGYMIVDGNCETKAKGIYGAGDVIAKKLRRVVTATNDGAVAIQHVFHEIKGI